MTRICEICGVDISHKRSDARWCNECSYQMKLKRNKENVKKYNTVISSDYYGQNCRICGVLLTKENTLLSQARVGIRTCNSCRKKYMKDLHHALKLKVYERMNPVCIKCGFSDTRALQIDHIHGGGTKANKYKSSYSYYKRLLELPIEELTQKYQILCSNCNWIKRYENNECGRP